MAYHSSSCLAGLVVLALILCSPPAPAEAISCSQAVEYLMPCQSFLMGLGQITAPCCQGARALAQATVSRTDRKSVCQCLKQVALSVNVNQDKAKQLPQLCKIEIPVPVQLNVNCDEIPSNEVSFRANPYKNLEQDAHSPGIGHGSPPGRPPLSVNKGLEQDAHSPGIGHGGPPGRGPPPIPVN